MGLFRQMQFAAVYPFRKKGWLEKIQEKTETSTAPAANFGVEIPLATDDFVGEDLQLSLGKFEPEKVGAIVLRMSARANGWHAIPWPVLVKEFLGDDQQVLFSFTLGNNAREVDRDIEALSGVTVLPPWGEAASEIVLPNGFFRGGYETSTVNGLPQTLVTGIDCLLQSGHVLRSPGSNGIEFIVPTPKLVERAQGAPERLF